MLFRGTTPVLVDVLSVARVDPSQPIWFAYGQFVRTFLLPMIAHAELGWPLGCTVARRDGYEPEELFTHLPWSACLWQPALSAVTLPHLLAGFAAGRASAHPGRKPTPDPELVSHILSRTFAKTLRQMRRATPSPRASVWSGYSDSATHYADADHARKQAFVADALKLARSSRVLDVGSNSGTYSLLAADAGAQVVAIDTDQDTVDQLCRNLHGTGRDILPLVVNLANPTPSVGWRNRESPSFLDRCSGCFDTVMMLAVLHHLMLHDQIPLAHIAGLCATLTTHTLIIEWVPPSDPRFQDLVRGRDSIFAHLTEQAFRERFAQRFTTVAEVKLANGRILFHMEKRRER